MKNWWKNVLRTLRGEPRVYGTLEELNPTREYRDYDGDRVRYSLYRGQWEYQGRLGWYTSYNVDGPFTEVR